MPIALAEVGLVLAVALGGVALAEAGPRVRRGALGGITRAGFSTAHDHAREVSRRDTGFRDP